MTKITKKKSDNMNGTTLNDLASMSQEQKNAFADRLLEQLMAAEESVKQNRKPSDVVVIDLKDSALYKETLKLYDESEYTVREYLVHDDIAAQFGAQIDGLVRLDEFYKLDLLLASGDIDSKDVDKIMKDILYTPGNVQGKVMSYTKKDVASAPGNVGDPPKDEFIPSAEVVEETKAEESK